MLALSLCLALLVTLTFVYVKAAISKSSLNDLVLNQYMENGELAQMTYSSRLINKCSPCLAFLVPGCIHHDANTTSSDSKGNNDEQFKSSKIVLCGNNNGNMGIMIRCKPLTSSLRKPHVTIKSDYNLVFSGVGYEADVSKVLGHIKETIESHLFTFGEVPPSAKLVSSSSAYLTKGLYQEMEDAFARPLAASLLLLAVESVRNNKKRDNVKVVLKEVLHTGLVTQSTMSTLGSLVEDTDVLNKIKTKITSYCTTMRETMQQTGYIDGFITLLRDILLLLDEHMAKKHDEAQMEYELFMMDSKGHKWSLPSPRASQDLILQRLREHMNLSV